MSLISSDFLDGSDGKESTCSAGLIPGLGRFPGKGNGYPLQSSWLENPKNRGALWVTVHRVAKSWTLLPTPGFLPEEFRGQRNLVDYRSCG